ncbi:MAG: SDR family NAD(P)-dependent oxidoreductase [Clostridia bacterium]
MRKLNWINNSNIVLSGASSGIGRELAILFCQKYNCKVFGLARNTDKLKSLKAEIGDNFDYLATDISIQQSWQQVYDKLVEINFCPDILINNAGVIHRFAKFRMLNDEIVNNTINTNFLSVVNSTRILLPLLDKSPKRAIINVSSASAYLACPGVSLYAATKSATLAFSEVLHEELSGEGYYVGAVMPGPVKTDLYKPRNKKTVDKLVKDNFITNFGISAQKASKQIISKMRRCRKRMTIGLPAHIMSFFYRLFPSFSIAVVGKVFRAVPLATYKEMFVDEKSKRKHSPRGKKSKKTPVIITEQPSQELSTDNQVAVAPSKITDSQTTNTPAK